MGGGSFPYDPSDRLRTQDPNRDPCKEVLEPNVCELQTRGDGWQEFDFDRPVRIGVVSGNEGNGIDWSTTDAGGGPAVILQAHPRTKPNIAEAVYEAHGGEKLLLTCGKWYVRAVTCRVPSERTVTRTPIVILDAASGPWNEFDSGLVMSAPAAIPTVAASSTQLLQRNPTRKYLEIRNTHATAIIDLGFGAAAVSGRGIRLGPNEFRIFSNEDISRQALYAISTVSGSTVQIQEAGCSSAIAVG